MKDKWLFSHVLTVSLNPRSVLTFQVHWFNQIWRTTLDLPFQVRTLPWITDYRNRYIEAGIQVNGPLHWVMGLRSLFSSPWSYHSHLSAECTELRISWVWWGWYCSPKGKYNPHVNPCSEQVTCEFRYYLNWGNAWARTTQGRQR